MQIIESFRNIFKIPELRKRIFITLGLLVVFRLGSHITLPGVDANAIESWQKRVAEQLGSLWAMLNVFSGGGLQGLALFSLGIMPYITSSIIMQLMTKVSPSLEAMVKEGPAGQRKINQYTRLLAIPICIIQAIFTINQIAGDQERGGDAVFYDTGFWSLAMMVMAITAGSMFIMWLGEQITEHGVGNGASLLIMSGIVARLPAIGLQLIEDVRKPGSDVTVEKIIIVVSVFVAIIGGIVFVTQAQRRIPIQHAKHFRGRRVWMGSRNYLPLRVNSSGVMPVIFASSLFIVPQILARVTGWKFFAMEQGTFFYTIFYVVLIFFFSYFWTYLFFQPVEIANNLKEYGSFIPGIRPGENTANYINTILSRITLCGAAFLCVIALLPDLVSAALGGDIHRQLLTFLGGTGILIVVGVGLDIIQKIESYLLMHHYEGFVGSGGIRGRR